MHESIYQIKGIDPIELLGINNSRIKAIKICFDDLKIISRGSTIKSIGVKERVAFFESKINYLINHIHTHGTLTDSDFQQLLKSENRNSITNEVILHGINGSKIKSRTLNQQKLFDAIKEKDLVFAVGPAGTGKTYTAIACAVRALKDKQVKRIILTRPAVEAGEHLGFLPGDLKDKLDPYMMPLYDALRDMIPPEKLDQYMEQGIIEIAPLAFMRGRTLDNAFVILDEAQNATFLQMKMFLTRMGKSAKFVINGDMTQIDLPKNQPSGLKDVIDQLIAISEIAVVHLNDEDVIRHPVVKKIIQVFEKINK